MTLWFSLNSRSGPWMGDLWSSANPVLLRGGGGVDQEMSMTTPMALTEGAHWENGRERTRKCGNLGIGNCKGERKDNFKTFGSDIGEDELERLMRIGWRKQMRMSSRNAARPDQLFPSPDRPMSQNSQKWGECSGWKIVCCLPHGFKEKANKQRKKTNENVEQEGWSKYVCAQIVGCHYIPRRHHRHSSRSSLVSLPMMMRSTIQIHYHDLHFRSTIMIHYFWHLRDLVVF